MVGLLVYTGSIIGTWKIPLHNPVLAITMLIVIMSEIVILFALVNALVN